MKYKKNQVLTSYRKACDMLVGAVNERLFEGFRSPYWVADIVGGVCNFDDTDFFTPNEMALILQNDVTYEQYAEWREARIEHYGKGAYVSLHAWLKGCRYTDNT